jgi:hypothetical protein
LKVARKAWKAKPTDRSAAVVLDNQEKQDNRDRTDRGSASSERDLSAREY